MSLITKLRNATFVAIGCAERANRMALCANYWDLPPHGLLGDRCYNRTSVSRVDLESRQPPHFGNGGISVGRHLLFISPDCDDFATGRLLELDVDPMRGVFVLRFITDAGDDIKANLHYQMELITPRYWGRLPTGWEIHPDKVAPVRGFVASP